MSETDNVKIARALLMEVGVAIERELGNHIARPFLTNKSQEEIEESARLAVFCEDMVKQCEMAERKAENDPETRLLSLLQKAQLYGNWEKPMGVRGTQKKAIECYEEALSLVPNGDKQAEALVRYHFALMARIAVAGVGGGKEKAIENFQRVVALLGTDDPLGLECAKELEKEKSEKKGGCFIATADYGSPLADEVIWLSRFRDEVLANHTSGRGFIRAYYATSPRIAAVIARSAVLRAIARFVLVQPASRLARHWLASKSRKQDV